MTTQNQISARFDVACTLAREAGALALRHFKKGVEVEFKADRSAVSVADRAVEDLVKDRLLHHFPDDHFYGEESGGSDTLSDQQGIWVVDPIDGTDCFVAGIPVWCVSIAYVVGKTVEIGVVFDPSNDELFTAQRGGGAFLNQVPIKASPATDLGQGVVGMGYSQRLPAAIFMDCLDRLLQAGGMFQRNGSGALMITYVGAGRMLGYFEAHLNSYDGLAAYLIAREAGAWCSDFLHGPFLTQGNPIAVAAPGVAGEIRKITQMEV